MCICAQFGEFTKAFSYMDDRFPYGNKRFGRTGQHGKMERWWSQVPEMEESLRGLERNKKHVHVLVSFQYVLFVARKCQFFQFRFYSGLDLPCFVEDDVVQA